MSRDEVDYSDVQGIVRFGYKKMTEAVYLLLRVKNAAAARAWLRTAPITNAVSMVPPPSTAVQVAFTAPGLAALGVTETILADFSTEFRTGMTAVDRSRRLGDVGTNAPARWVWGGDDGTNALHLVVMMFAEPDNGGVAALMRRVQDNGWHDSFDLVHRLDTSQLDGVEPFGFTDGISQPTIDWEQARDLTTAPLDYTNIVALGEVLLGYRNEYGKFTERPLLDAGHTTNNLLNAQDEPAMKDLGRNGTYLVMRQLEQDVRGFWRFIAEHAGGGASDYDTLAAKLVGRTRSGEPLVQQQSQPIQGTGSKPDDVRLNQFTFDADPDGVRCPFGAHVRRANPRNADLPGHPTGIARLTAMLGLGRTTLLDDLTSSVRFHRLLRRGREYGPGLAPTDALAPAPPNEPERGIQFICLNANISRQFEFLQNAWIMNSKFDGMSGESDPLLGNREPLASGTGTATFSIPQRESPSQRLDGLPQFVTVRGGAYFFLPSLRALQFLAAE